MSIRTNDWELLNAYMDGELTATERQAIDARLRAEPDLQAELRRLEALKSSVKISLAPATQSQETQPATTRWKLKIAASILVVMVGASAAWYLAQPQNTTMAETLHRDYSEKSYLLDATPRMLQVSSPVLGDFQIPDLSPSNLQLADARLEPSQGGEILSAHYRGLRGCRLTFVSASHATDTAANPSSNNGVVFTQQDRALKAKWQSATHTVTVLATGMDENRFATISRYLRQELQLQQKEREDTLRTAMAAAYAKARPCA